MLRISSCLVFFLLTAILLSETHASEFIKVTKDNYDAVVPKGKEVDAIVGDYVLRNKEIVAVIANTKPGRKANMTTRGVAGMVIDLTRRSRQSDQLSCFYTGGGQYQIDQLISVTTDGSDVDLSSNDSVKAPKIQLTFLGKPVAKNASQMRVNYSIEDDSPYISYEVEIMDATAAKNLKREDSIRCDGNLFTIREDGKHGSILATDRFFGQAYGIYTSAGKLSLGSGRARPIQQPAADADSENRWHGKIFCSQSEIGVLSCLQTLAQQNLNTYPVSLTLQAPKYPVSHALVKLQRLDVSPAQSLGEGLTDQNGVLKLELIPGRYKAEITADGYEKRIHEFDVTKSRRADSLSFSAPARVIGRVRDAQGKGVAAKIEFVGLDGTASPNFGPDSAAYAVKNLVYTATGKFERPIAPGKYLIRASHGTEYDMQELEIELQSGQARSVEFSLAHSVNSNGWVSTEFHSHSSPSGDNVSDQRGRVLNLLAENLEFAPCTEHNRIDTYSDDLLALNAVSQMATCTGMELTGSPLPINHQNAFPLVMHEHTQDGGGPQTDANPVKQIERLALWDNSSSKVVQTNHPNIPQILGDKDLDGNPDGGFRGMLGWMDVIEVHPPEAIFSTPNPAATPKEKYDTPILYWMQLLNLGYRITGVVNTDAHYNFHGSGWLRNYLASSSDDPAQIQIAEMIHSAEHGHVIMTTGPYLKAELRLAGQPDKVYISGDDVDVTDQKVKLKIEVQCPNWFDVNRVQVFANGRADPKLNFTRRTSPGLFSDKTVRFRAELVLPEFDEDTHLIVATIGEGMKLGPVMGPTAGELPPVAVANPIFLDVDGNGFRPNGDTLGLPLMIPKE